MISLVGFSQCVPHSQAIGQWKNPEDQFAEGYRQLESWCHIAKTLEKGLVDGFFLADIHGIYDVYGNSRDAAHRYAVQTPGVDPMLLTSAMANVTTHLGFINTYSTTFHAPYECARAFSSLDHFTNGRIGWNIVTSYTHSAEANGIGKMLNHDKRYDRADEFMDVVYKLWEASWEKDAVIQDVEKDAHTDPSKVHEINHIGEHFSVKGPHMCEPSIQRTPVLFQAGASKRGSEFGTKHAEGIFMEYPRFFEDAEFMTNKISKLREQVSEHGRDPHSVKIMMAITPIVATSEKEALEKETWLKQFNSPEGHLALFGGHTGIDLEGLDYETPIENINLEGMQHIALKWKGKTINQMLSQRPPTCVGSTKQVVDRMEELISYGVDGFVVHPMIQPQSHEDLVNLIIPELQKRKLFRTKYDHSTLRGNLLGSEDGLSDSNHPSAKYRP